MNIIKFYILYVFIKLISSEDIIEDKFFYNKKFYLELKNSIFYTTIIQNSVSNELMSLLPLENQQTFFDNEKILIHLSVYINIDKSIKTSNLIKGNIYIDGSNLIIYYGSSRINENESLVILGNIEKIDSLIDTIINDKISIINIKMSCEISFIVDEKVYNVSKSNPTIILINKYSFDFNTVPNIYYGDDKHEEPLYKNCKINKDKKFEILCSFSEDEIKKNFFLYKKSVVIFEIIPGCSKKIYSQIYINFNYIIKNCKKFSNDFYKCKECKNKNYKVSINGEKCVFTSYFYYICIGLPIINIFFIIICIAIVINYGNKDNKICTAVCFGIGLALLDTLSFLPLY